MKSKPLSIGAAILLLALPLSQATASVIFYEGFESPVIFDFNSSVFSPGWSLNEPNSQQLGLRNGLFPYDGIQVAQINANNSPAGASFSRFIPTSIDQTYTVSLRYLSYASTSAAVKVDFGAASFSSPVTPLVNTWYELTFNYTATAPETMLTISDVTTNTVSSDLFVDAVSITSIPEPSAAVWVSLAAFSFLLLRRRRR
ncbi:MAG: PEP-CTERM sorting domain-containing protein [Verrucomicrobiota bacterium]|nr:PEP-CTERM sorting domain-containing protein [Verrucomicrobiota bacterium]